MILFIGSILKKKPQIITVVPRVYESFTNFFLAVLANQDTSISACVCCPPPPPFFALWYLFSETYPEPDQQIGSPLCR